MANVLLEQEPATGVEAPARAADATSLAAQMQRWLPVLVLVAAVCTSLFIYAWFWDNSRYLWWWMGHDRHTHYMYGLNLALDVRSADVGRLLHDFDRMRVWGPLHPVLVALVELVAGPDQRLAVLPSLAGWIMTMWFAFLIPRRLLPTGGDAAGIIAAFLVAVSPAHRAFATDVMYESLGAGLSLACLYLYLVTVQAPSLEGDGKPRWRAGIALALALSALFLHKYQYWLLVGFGLIAGEFARQPRAWVQYALGLCRRDRLPSWLLGEVKQPLNWLALALAGAAVAVALTGGGAITLAGKHLSFQEPHNFVHLAYVAFFLRVVLWWRRTGLAWSRQLPTPLRDVLCWHGSIVLLWFLLPKRLSYFIWYMAIANDQPRDSVPFMHGLPFYLNAFQHDYLALPWGLYVCVAMVLMGAVCWRWWKPGSAAIFCFVLIAVYLTSQHPMLKNRLMHSWIAAVWVLGAAGLVWVTQKSAGWLAPAAPPWAAAAVCVLFIGWQAPAFLEPGHAQEGGVKREEPSPLVIPDTYLPALADAKNPTIFCNVSTRFLLTWTFIEYHHHQRFTADIKNYRANFENNPQQIARWLETTTSDALVVIDVHPRSTFDWVTDEYVDLTALKQTLAGQAVFVAAQTWELPDGVTITLWKKKA